VYAIFGSKVNVLTAVLNARLAPAGQASVMDRPESRAVRDEPDPRRQLHRFAHDMAAVSARIRPIYEVLRTVGAVEPEVAEVFAEMERHRLAHMRQLAGWFARRGPLRVSRNRAPVIGMLEGLGTVYTARYRPGNGRVTYYWPDESWEQSFDQFAPGTRTVTLG
jgi:hypothetical protein